MSILLVLLAASVAKDPNGLAYPHGEVWIPTAVDSARLRSDGTGFAARVDRSVLTLELGDRGLRVRSTTFGRVGASRCLGAGAQSARGARLEIDRPGLVESFEARRGGIEQSWRVATAPARDQDTHLWIGVDFDGLSPQITEDGLAASLVDERGLHRLSYRNLRVRDASGRPLSARMAVVEGEFGIQVDDRGASYPIDVDPFLGTSDWSWAPSDSPALQPLAAQTLIDHVACGDFNGDGYTDVLVAGGYHAGRGHMWLFLGSASGPSWPNPDWDTGGPIPQATSVFGTTMTVLGDISGDGIDDFAVSQVNYSGTYTAQGAVHVYLGNASGTPTLLWTFQGLSSNDSIASASKYIGDVDGDGRNELAIHHWSTGISGPGEHIHVYRGWSSGAPGAPLWTLYDTDLSPTYIDANYSNNALSIQNCGDVDSDGYSDLLVHAFQDANLHGRLLLFRGGPAGPPGGTTPTWTATPPGLPSGAQFAGSVAGDIDGNGYPDIVAGDGGGLPSWFGRLFTYLTNPSVHGSALLPATPSQTISDPNQSNGQFFATRREPAGDFDGDGFADVVVGTYYSLNPLETNGNERLYVYRGGAGGLATTPFQEFATPQLYSNYGARVGPAGDVNGDGLNDVWTTERAYDGPGGAYSDEGAVLVYFGRRTPALVAAPGQGAASISGTSTSGFGRAVSTGDVNGDGIDDLLVGSPDYSNGETGEGRVDLFLGDGLCGFRTTPDWSYESNAAGAHLGASVAIVGDVDNDGYTDVVAGAPDFGGVLAGQGKAFLFRGRPPCAGNPQQPCPHTPCTNLLTQTASWTYVGASVNAHVGASVAGAGDVNGDGLGDVLIGAPGDFAGQADRGAVHVFHGRAAGTPVLTLSVTLDEGQQGSQFGAAVAAAGDIDRDGYSDVIVGAPGWSNGAILREGRVFAYRGGPAGVNPVADWLYGALNEPNAELGASVASCGDVDATGSPSSSGYSDVIVGAPGFPAGSGGTAFVFTGQGGVGPHLGATPQAVLGELQPGARHGAAVCSAGDVNGDGFSDVLVGAPGYDGTNGIDAGRVRLHLGRSTGIDGSPAWTIEGPAPGAELGRWVAGGGDFDGNGYGDLAWGVPGNSGITIGSGYTATGVNHAYQQRRAGDALAIALLGESEQTTSLRLRATVGNPLNHSSTPAGRVDIRLEWELKPLSGVLDGTGLQRQASFTDSGPFAGAPPLLSALVTGLSPTMPYQWRSRIQYANPTLAHTRWLQLQGNGKRNTKFRLGTDCNGNGATDAFDLQSGASQDCNLNSIPDECDIAASTSSDCNADGTPDECQLLANDCDNNGVPDDCQLAGADCDMNGTFDPCDVLIYGAPDSNGDLVPDSCQSPLNNVLLYCAGDGVSPHTNCPCSNNSQAGNEDGCLNSLGTGARLRHAGIARVTAPYDNFTLLGTQMPNSSALYFQGTAQQNAGNGSPFGDGLRCAAGAVLRLGTKVNSAGASQYPMPGDLPVSIRGSLPSSGGTRYYQIWYRNAAAFCTAATFNLSNGLRVTWIP